MMINPVLSFIGNCIIIAVAILWGYYWAYYIHVIQKRKVVKSRAKRVRISESLRREVFTRDNNTCQECGFTGCCSPHIDHIIPVVDGGETTLENLRFTCASCNLRKGRKRSTIPKNIDNTLSNMRNTE